MLYRCKVFTFYNWKSTKDGQKHTRKFFLHRDHQNSFSRHLKDYKKLVENVSFSHTHHLCFSVCIQVPLRGRLRRQQGPLNMNHYANKKSAAESMLDVALLMANASQLKAVLQQGPDFTFYVPLITLISISLILQILVGIMLIFIGMSGHHILFDEILFNNAWKATYIQYIGLIEITPLSPCSLTSDRVNIYHFYCFGYSVPW